MRVAGIAAPIAVTVGMFACTTGDTPPTGMQQEGILCSTYYSAAGTFVANTSGSNAEPTGFTGCWPMGLWTFTLTKDTGDANGSGGPDSCSTGGHEPTPLAQYQFTGSVSGLDANGDPQETFTYMPQSSDPTANYTAKVTEGGSGICEGSLVLYDASGEHVWTLKPELATDYMTIGGGAEYDLFGSNQWNGM